MNNKFNKILAIVLCLVMAIGSVAAVVEGDPTPSPVPTEAPVTTEAPVETAVPSVPPVAETEAPVEESPVPTEAPESPVPTEAPAEPVLPEEPAHIDTCVEGCTGEGCDCSCHKLNLYEQLMACTSIEEINAVLDGATEEEITAYLDTLTDEELIALVEYLETQEIAEDSFPYLMAYLEMRFPPYSFLSCVNDTAAAPLMQMVFPRRMMLKAPSARGNDNNGLETSKTVVKKADGTYTLRLEAYATGETYTTETSKPTDIVLVLDTSGSMDDYISVADKESVANLDPNYAQYYKWNSGLVWREMRYQDGTWQYNSVLGWKACDNSWFGNAAGIKKIDALKIAVDGFLTSTAANGGDNRVALVTYATGANTLNGLTNDFNSIKNNVWGLVANGATYADSGMSNAKGVIDGIPSDRNSNKVVIMFTDGEPNHQNGFDTSVANSTISTSKQMKDTGVTVYTIGVMDGANNADTSSNFNKYMNYVSSNYPYATSMNNGGTKYEHPDGGNYYLTADNLEALKDIFQNISSEVGGATNSKLDSTTVMKDIISSAFQLPDGANATDIQVYTADCTAINSDIPTFGSDQASGLTASIAEDSRTILVTGFDYSANYVGKNTTTGALHTPGKKLIIEIPIERATSFLGGNNVPTNGTESGVYDKDGTLVEAFDIPTVDLPIHYAFSTTDQTIYLGEKADLTRLSSSDIVPDGSNNAFVNIRYTVTDPEGKLVGTMSIPAGQTSGEWTWTPDAAPALEKDTKYTINCVVSPSIPKVDGVANWEETKSATVYVRTCTLTITKQGSQDDNQGFIFKVTGPKAFTVSVQGNRSVTIAGLPIGSYTVTEDGWSWRYSADGEKTAELTPTAPAGSVTVNNALQNPYLLDGSAYAQNNAAKPAAKG